MSHDEEYGITASVVCTQCVTPNYHSNDMNQLYKFKFDLQPDSLTIKVVKPAIHKTSISSEIILMTKR